jgi:type II secretory pathway pseudopilin PulG
MQTRRSNNEAGFSLIELIIAMTITITVMGLASSILASAFNVRSREDRKSDAVADVQAAVGTAERVVERHSQQR